MKKYIFITFWAFILIFVANNVYAKNYNAGENSLIPSNAVKVSDNVYSLGTSVDKHDGRKVQGYAIVHYKKGYGKPDGTPGNGSGGKGGGGSSCYGFLAKGAKWKSVEDWVVNTSNPDGISDSSVFSILDGGITKWENASGVNILGNGASTSSILKADMVSTDNVNEVYFDSLEQGTIGITVVWGIFGGPPSGRKLVEWDQVYNTYYPWSDTGDVYSMDFENIATHELGHSVGMGDLYDSTCANETMYGYGDLGETKKHDLNAGDIEGINKLY